MSGLLGCRACCLCAPLCRCRCPLPLRTQQVATTLPARSERSGPQVLEAPSAARTWSAGQVTPLPGSDPPVQAIQASLSLPLKAPIKACDNPSQQLALSPVPSLAFAFEFFQSV